MTPKVGIDIQQRAIPTRYTELSSPPVTGQFLVGNIRQSRANAMEHVVRIDDPLHLQVGSKFCHAAFL
jgi:hypothetical protein